ncbi:MAG: hypothetical protein LBB38_03525 [Puniceicoccales bacterium]|jgi:primosomal protein N'|nr:hypothetical protein [Puniceicoccales bacterium]
MAPRLATVEIFSGPGKPLDYSVPEELANKICVGSLVEVSLRNRRCIAVVISLDGKTFTGQAKAILRAVGDGPFLSKNLVSLARWTAANYGNPLWKIFEFMVPKKLRKLQAAKRKRTSKKTKSPPEPADRTGFLWPQDE